MAHEFAHYDGALGPEGVRRTVTYYGPVVGGLPIQAWHCEICGLLRLTYPDGRTEERRLFPGPQPGLIATATPVAPEALEYGLQARVSGLSAQPVYYDQLALSTGFTSGQPVAIRLPSITLPEFDAVTWLLVLGLSLIALTLLVMGFLAVYTYSTPSIELPLAIIVSCSFVGLMLFALGVAAIRHFFPAEQLAPSVAEQARGRASLDGATRTAIALLVLSVIGFFTAGVLAVYTFATPGAEGPVFLLSVVLAVLAALIMIVSSAVNHFRR
jgi:MFS family permease